jgi:hypothetical protein
MPFHDERGGGEDRRVHDARIFVENIEDLAARLRPGDPVPDLDRIDGADRRGAVHCVVDLRGRLLRVGIDDGWWDSVGPALIGSAVLDALRFAKSKATMARLVLDRHGHLAGAAPTDFGALFTGEPSTPLPDYDAPGFPAALVRKAGRAMTILETAERVSRTRASAQRRVVTGPRRMFQVVLSGGDIVAAEVNEHGLRPADAADLAADATAALQAVAPGPGGAR